MTANHVEDACEQAVRESIENLAIRICG